jgi:hypothetical protein
MFEFKDPPGGDFKLPCTPERLTWQMECIGWGRAELADRLNVRTSKVAAWEKGTAFIPNNVAVWLETLATMMYALNIPIGWNPDKSLGREHHVEGKRTLDPEWRTDNFTREQDDPSECLNDRG